ncbi:MAG: hypothetical protein ACREAA_21260 [Candidatus Polarisedimenticolia bacterium]
MMRTIGAIALVHVLVAVPLQAPFQTLLPWCLDRGQSEIIAGVAWARGTRPPFLTEEPGLVRDPDWALDLVDVSHGVGPGSEVRIQWGLQRFEQMDGETVSGVQDVRLWFAHQIPVAGLTGAFSFMVKLPNAPDDDLLGTDQTDVHLLGSVGWQSSVWGWAGQAGLGLLGNPLPGDNTSQDDVLLFGVAAWRGFGAGDLNGPFILASLEVAGQAASRFGNDVREATAGLTLASLRFPITMTSSWGLTSVSEDWAVAVRVTVMSNPGVTR